jgi:hypothetical protein
MDAPLHNVSSSPAFDETAHSATRPYTAPSPPDEGGGEDDVDSGTAEYQEYEDDFDT